MRASLVFTFALISIPTISLAIPSFSHAQTKNICTLLNANPDWAESVVAAEEKWGVSAGNILAFIDQESRFRANASSGPNYGYAQATQQTWNGFLKDTKIGNKSRSDFDASVNFVGWHFKQMNKQFGIGMNNVSEQYLAYQLGSGGYKKGAPPASRRIAASVASRARIFEDQLDNCD